MQKRFITEPLKQFEDKILSANEKSQALEKSIYANVLTDLLDYVNDIQQCADGVAEIDVLTNFSLQADRLDLTRPELVEDMTLNIKQGRHPVVEYFQKK